MNVRLPAGERRQTVVDAALSVFGERGYTDASLDEIAGRAGVTKPILYRHFANKQALYLSLLEDQARAMEDAGRARFEPGGVRRYPDDPAREIVDALFAYLEEFPFTLRVLQREPEPQPAIAQARGRIHVLILRQATTILLQIRPELRTREPDRRRELETYAEMIAGTQAHAARWWLENRDVPREEIVDRVMRFLDAGVRGIA